MFVLSKLLSAITQPVFWLVLWWALSLLILARWRRLAVAMLWGGLVVLGLLGFRAIPDALLRPLENRYPVPAAAAIERHAGIIVLGGALGHPDSYKAHGQVPLGDAAERMTVPVGLVRQHPTQELVFSGGEGRLLTLGVTESELARVFLPAAGPGHDQGALGRWVAQHPRERTASCQVVGPSMSTAVAAGDFGLAHAALDGRVRGGGMQCHAVPCGLPYRRVNRADRIRVGAQPFALADRVARVVGLVGVRANALRLGVTALHRGDNPHHEITPCRCGR